MNKKTLSFENSRRLMDRMSLVDNNLHDIINRHIYEGIDEAYKDVTKQANKAVYEMAEKQGVSIWSICLRFVPEYDEKCVYKEDGIGSPGYTFEVSVKLVPVELEFEKGPGYWKDKYLRLKEKMQNIIDEKDDDHD